jgi:hypothetical protein
MKTTGKHDSVIDRRETYHDARAAATELERGIREFRSTAASNGSTATLLI